MKKIMSVALALCMTGCHTPTTQTDREPSNERTFEAKAQKVTAELIEIVKSDNQGQGLYMLEDSANQKFSVAECTASATAVDFKLLEGATCTMISDDWIPSDRRFRAAFDQAFETAIAQENQSLYFRRKVRDAFTAVFAGAAIGHTTGLTIEMFAKRVPVRSETVRPGMTGYFASDIYSKLSIPRVFVISASVTVGLVAAAVIIKHLNAEPPLSIEASLTKKKLVRDATATKVVSAEIYAGIRRSLALALATQPST